MPVTGATLGYRKRAHEARADAGLLAWSRQPRGPGRARSGARPVRAPGEGPLSGFVPARALPAPEPRVRGAQSVPHAWVRGPRLEPPCGCPDSAGRRPRTGPLCNTPGGWGRRAGACPLRSLEPKPPGEVRALAQTAAERGDAGTLLGCHLHERWAGASRVATVLAHALAATLGEPLRRPKPGGTSTRRRPSSARPHRAGRDRSPSAADVGCLCGAALPLGH